MFIKKDLRKIPAILSDAEEKENVNIRDLRLQRRKAEFKGSIKILASPSHAPALSNLQSLSLYECEISNIDGIGMLESLECLSLGRNPLKEIPKEFHQLEQLKELWMEDCLLQGELPAPILQLPKLEELRLSNNQIDSLPETISDLVNLRVLSLDRNRLKTLPQSLQLLSQLETLLLRHNELTQLPEGVPGPLMGSLKLLHLSSNQLTTLPLSLADCHSLTHIYLNGNHLESLPDNFDYLLSKSSSLKHCNLAHNKIDRFPMGSTNADGLMEDVKEGCHINVRDNPFWKRQYGSPRDKKRTAAP